MKVSMKRTRLCLAVLRAEEEEVLKEGQRDGEMTAAMRAVVDLTESTLVFGTVQCLLSLSAAFVLMTAYVRCEH